MECEVQSGYSLWGLYSNMEQVIQRAKYLMASSRLGKKETELYFRILCAMELHGISCPLIIFDHIQEMTNCKYKWEGEFERQ